MTVFDYVFLAVLALSMLIGIWRGFVGEVFALLGWLIAFFVARQFAPAVVPLWGDWISTPWMRWVAAFALIFVVCLLVLALLRFLVARLLSAAGLAPIDRLMGAGFGAIRALIVAVLAVAAAGLTSWPRETWWQDAYFAPPLETAVIAAKPWMPQDLAARIKYR